MTSLLVLAALGLVAPAAQPLGEPVLEPPTWRCLGCYWLIAGDDNRDARVELRWRYAGQTDWRRGPDLFRVERGVKPGAYPFKLAVPEGAWLFAGSLIDVEPNRGYELKLNLVDPDGGAAERVLTAATPDEPRLPADRPVRTLHVKPGAGGGTGSAAEPYLGLVAASAAVRPGDLVLVHAGVYPATWSVGRGGEPNLPIVWRAAGDGPVVLDGQRPGAKRAGRGIDVVGRHDVWFEGLEIRHADYGLVGHEASRIVVRGCWFHDCDFGITCTRNDTDAVRGWWILDNRFQGPCSWPRSKGIEDPRGIQVTGTQMVVAHNRISGYGDGLDTFPSPRCENIDFCYNEVSECTDDGCELDYSVRNTRCFKNRFVNCFDGLSVQPIHGGPAYLVRNVCYNQGMGPFKLHNGPSGALFIHNTTVKRGPALEISTRESVHNCVMRNNLLLGTADRYCFEAIPTMVDCDFDWCGWGGGPFGMFLKWNGARFKTLSELRGKGPAFAHGTLVEAGPFAGGLAAPESLERRHDPATVDTRLKADSAAVDAGVTLPGFNDGYAGQAPDLGACEYGQPLPAYGPR